MMTLPSKHAPKLQVVCQWKEPGQTVFSAHQPLVLAEERSGDGAMVAIFDALLEKCEALQVFTPNPF